MFHRKNGNKSNPGSEVAASIGKRGNIVAEHSLFERYPNTTPERSTERSFLLRLSSQSVLAAGGGFLFVFGGGGFAQQQQREEAADEHRY